MVVTSSPLGGKPSFWMTAQTVLSMVITAGSLPCPPYRIQSICPRMQSVLCLIIDPTLHPEPVLALTKDLWLLGGATRDILGTNIRVSQARNFPASTFLS